MLSILAYYSMFAIIPLYVCLACFEQRDLLSKRRPKYRPRLWVIVILVILLAIDFAVSSTQRYPDSGLHWSHTTEGKMYVSDTCVVLIPLLCAMLARHSIWELWFLACVVGLIGVLILPALAVR
jgi:hypothetical protein